MTIEDETGIANLVVFRNLFEKYRGPVLQARLLMVEGKLQRTGEVIHVVVHHCYDYSHFLRHLTSESASFRATNKRTQIRKHVQEKLFPEARNFR